MLKSLSLTTACLIAFVLATVTASASAASTKARAQIWSDGPGLKALALYESKTKGQQTRQKLEVHIKHALPLQTLDVSIDGVLVGTITANPAGKGKLKLRSPQNVIPPITSGSVLTVGALTGTFYTKADRYKVQAPLSLDGTTVVGTTKYHQKPHKGQLDRRFKVNIAGATPGEQFDVWVKGVFVASIIADDLGEGSLKLRSAAFANGEWQPMPDDFPALVEGDVVTVGAMTTTLQ